MKGEDIIMFGLQPWDIEIGSNFKNMALEMSLNNRVLYVNRPLDRITYYKKRKDKIAQARINSIKKGINIIEEVHKNLWAFNPRTMLDSINWMPQGAVYKYFNKKNNLKLAKQILWATKKLNFSKYILIIDNDFFNGLYLKDYLKPKTFIYYIRDYLLSQPYFVKHGKTAEPLIIQKADIVVTNSTYLAAYAKKYNQVSIDIGQGCDVNDFLDQPDHVPEDVVNIKHPVIGYCGALITSRLDINLIYFIAKERSDWNIVLVGPEDDNFKNSALHDLKNVYFTGKKSASELPSYVHYFDVCINPQVLNQMTIGNYPRKVDEYLAAGKPVVATETDAMQIFADYTYLCKNNKDYINAIGRALDESDKKEKAERRMLFAKSHTWQASVNKLYQAIKNLN